MFVRNFLIFSRPY